MDHPDPSMIQFRTFQKAFGPSGLIAGHPARVSPRTFAGGSNVRSKSVQTKEWKRVFGKPEEVYVWYDYFSNPQSIPGEDFENDQRRAIDSIYAYVNVCKHFVVLSTPSFHDNGDGRTVELCTWEKRGWCRLEVIARALSHNATRALVIQSPGRMYFLDMRSYLRKPVGEGSFGCCERGHQIAAAGAAPHAIPCDKERLSPALFSLICSQLKYHLDAQEMDAYRFMCTISRPGGWLFRGVPDASVIRALHSFKSQLAPSRTVEQFLEFYKFASPFANQSRATLGDGLSTVGTTPLLYAAAAGNVDVLRELLGIPEVLKAVNLPVAATVKSGQYGVLLERGMTPLLAAAAFTGSREVCQMLLDHGAEAGASCHMHGAGPGAKRATAPFLMCVSNNAQCLGWWLGKFKDAAGDRNSMGASVLGVACGE